MKVSELISQLQAMPQDMRVIVEGYEGGYDDIALPLLWIPVAIGKTSSYCGAHGDPGPPSFGETYPIEQCVLLSSGR